MGVTTSAYEHLKTEVGARNLPTLLHMVLVRETFVVVNDCRISPNSLKLFAPWRNVVFLEGPSLVQIADVGRQLIEEKADKGVPRSLYYFKRITGAQIPSLRELPEFGWVASTEEDMMIAQWPTLDIAEKCWQKGESALPAVDFEARVMADAEKSHTPDAVIEKATRRILRLVDLGMAFVSGKREVKVDQLKKALSCNDAELSVVRDVAHREYFTILTSPLQRPRSVQELLPDDVLTNKAKVLRSRLKREVGENALDFGSIKDPKARGIAQWIKGHLDSVLGEESEGLSDTERDTASAALFVKLCALEKGDKWWAGQTRR